MSHKGAVSSAELGSRSGLASALSDLVDHEGESDAHHPGVLGQGDALLSGTQRTVRRFSDAYGEALMRASSQADIDRAVQEIKAAQRG